MDEITLTTLNMALWRPIVDGIIHRYNIAESRTEAGASAVVLLEAMRTMGVFDAPPMREPVRQRGEEAIGKWDDRLPHGEASPPWAMKIPPAPQPPGREAPIPTQTPYAVMVEAMHSRAGPPTAFSNVEGSPDEDAAVEAARRRALADLGLPKREPGIDMKAPGYELKRGHPSDVT